MDTPREAHGDTHVRVYTSQREHSYLAAGSWEAVTKCMLPGQGDWPRLSPCIFMGSDYGTLSEDFYSQISEVSFQGSKASPQLNMGMELRPRRGRTAWGGDRESTVWCHGTREATPGAPHPQTGPVKPMTPPLTVWATRGECGPERAESSRPPTRPGGGRAGHDACPLPASDLTL